MFFRLKAGSSGRLICLCFRDPSTAQKWKQVLLLLMGKFSNSSESATDMQIETFDVSSSEEDQMDPERELFLHSHGPISPNKSPVTGNENIGILSPTPSSDVKNTSDNSNQNDLDHEEKWLLAVAELEQLKRRIKRKRQKTSHQFTSQRSKISSLERKVKSREHKIRVLRSQMRTMESIMTSMTSEDVGGQSLVCRSAGDVTLAGVSENRNPEPFSMSAVDESKLRAIFDHVDKDKSGDINVREMVLGLRHDAKLRNILHLPAHIRENDGTQDAFERVFQEMDDDNNRRITFDQFRDHIASWRDNNAYLNDAESSNRELALIPRMNNKAKSSPDAIEDDQHNISDLLIRVSELEVKLNAERKAKEIAFDKLRQLVDSQSKAKVTESTENVRADLEAEMVQKESVRIHEESEKLKVELNETKESLNRSLASAKTFKDEALLAQEELLNMRDALKQSQQGENKAQLLIREETEKLKVELNETKESLNRSLASTKTFKDEALLAQEELRNMKDAMKHSQQGQNEIQRLESKMKLLQEQLDSAHKDHDTVLQDLKEEFEMSQRSMKLKAEQAIQSLKDSESKNNSVVSTLRAELADREEEHAQTVANIKSHYEASSSEDASRIAEQLLATQKEHSAKLSDLRQNLAEEKHRYTELQKQLRESKSIQNNDRMQLSEMISIKDQNEQKWKTKLEELEKALKAANDEYALKFEDNQALLASSEKKLARAESKLSNTASELASSESQLKESLSQRHSEENMMAQITSLEEELTLEKNTKKEFHKKVRERISLYKVKEKELMDKVTSMESASREESDKIATELASSRLTITELNKILNQTSEENKAHIMRSLKATLRRWMHVGLQCGWSSWMRFVLKSREIESKKHIAEIKAEAELTQAKLVSFQRKLEINEEEKEDSIRTIERSKKREAEKVAALEEEIQRRQEDHARAVKRMRSDLDQLHQELASERSKRSFALNHEQEDILSKEIVSLRAKLLSAQTKTSEMEIHKDQRKYLEKELQNTKDAATQMEIQMRAAEARCQAANSKVRDQEDKLKQLQTQSRKYAMKISSMEKQLDHFRKLAQTATLKEKEKRREHLSKLKAEASKKRQASTEAKLAKSHVMYIYPITCSETALEEVLMRSGSGRIIKVAVSVAKKVAAVAFATQGGMGNISSAVALGTLRIDGERVKIISK